MGGADNRLIAMFDGGVAFWLVLAVALGVGVVHAVAPGHGKSITAAYLIGTHGRYRDAVRLGVIVAVMHTFSVLVLAVAWVGLSGVAGLGTKSITAWLQVLAGLVVIGVGAHLVYRHLRERRNGTGHGHGHGHGHGPGHEHGHGHGHLGAGPESPVSGEAHGDVATQSPTDPWSRRGLVALALSGGLLPSPSAFIVLVSGLLTGRALDAVVLVIAFGVGMAATLTAVGVVTIKGGGLLARRARSWSPAAAVAVWLPAVAGVAVSLGGCLYLFAAVGALTT
ncbi:hypothetical protein Aph01nite_73360 [Acrocarpospora phusangensis]|uniref:Nickel/cobalt efflux system n=1 Tax=Acrocarpospora phusangensis TaxID=1070424 RepID=A0A919UNY6_9ACTN|nr:hypothetical protein [Acrocarpospora phusangensis]GIH29026.1 hypothetical protein Aph01nite_73360 [Acrocarpospora phusangensis]